MRAAHVFVCLFAVLTLFGCASRPINEPIATGTDLSTGSRLAYFQNDFDLLCSDLNKVRLWRAAAPSSAVPVVLSPVTLNNSGGTCGYRYPAWVQSVSDPKTQAGPRDAPTSVIWR